MGSVERKDRTHWVARWRDDQGRQRKKTFPRRIDADRHLAEMESSKARGAYIDTASRTTVLEATEQWAASRPHRPTTAKRTASMIRTHLASSSLAGRRLVEVRPSMVQAFLTERSQVLAPSTVHLLAAMLRSVFNAAVLDRRIAASPMAGVHLPRADRARLVPLTPAQVLALADAVPTRLRALVLAQAGCGLRIGEALGLRVQDVDFLGGSEQGRCLRIEGQVLGTRVRAEPKTPRSRRTVPLPAVVADALAAHLATYPPGPDGTIFVTSRGTYTHHETVTRALARAVADLSLPPGTSSHDLRHAYASLLLAAGESVITVAERLGHEDATLVMKVYGHLVPGHEVRTRAVVDAAFRAPEVPASPLAAL